MLRKALGLVFASALAFSWAGPLCARPEAPSHACCMGGQAPQPAPNGDLPACCRPSDSAPLSAAATVPAPAPALPPSAVIAAEPVRSHRIAPARFVPAAPQAPPGKHSGLSPPSSGL